MSQVQHPIKDFRDYALDNIGGPRLIKARHIINFQKGATFIFVVYLMNLYQNFSLGAYLYLAVHGSYGWCWVLKDYAFGDKSWDYTPTLGSAALYVTALGCYWILPWLQLSGAGIDNPSNARIITVIVLYVMGVVIMMASDAQKYYTLKYKKGLIDEGMFAYTRNPNYFGEICIYLSFAIIVGHPLAYAIPMTVWCTLFAMNMFIKDLSFQKKQGWDKYKEKSYILIPRLFHSHIMNLGVYGFMVYYLYLDYQEGGFLNRLKK